MALRTVGIRLLAEVAAYKSGIKQARDSTSSFVQELDKAAKAGQLDSVAHQASRVGLALAGAFAAVEVAAAKFEQQMSKVEAVTTTSAEGMHRLEQAALDAGKATQYSATEAAQAEEELAKAGISVNDILTGGLTGSLALAAAGSLDLAEAADTAAKTMNMFKLRGADVGHIADVLSASANKSATDVHELGMALKMGGLAASAAGMGLEETVGTLSAFADRALVGSDAGTSLKTMLMFLQAPSIKAAELMKKLGIEAYDASGNFIGTTKLAGVLQRQLGGLTQEERNAALATIFGADAMRAANVLYTVGEQGVRDYTQAVDDQGAAAEAARKKTDNLIGDIERLTGTLETMAIESGGGANSGLRILVQMLQGILDQFGKLPPAVSGTVVILAGLTGAALLAGAAFIRVRTTAADVNKELIAMGPAGVRAATALSAVTKWGGRAAGVFAGLQIVGAIGSAMSGAAADADRLANALKNLPANQAASGELGRVFGGDLERLRSNLNFLRKGLDNAQGAANIESMFGLSGFSFSTAKRLEEMKALDSALAQLASGGNARDAEAWFGRITEEAARQGISLEQLKGLFPGYVAAAEQAARATSGQAAAHEQAAANAAVLESGLAGLVKQTGSLTKAWEALHGTQVSWAEAQIDVEQAIDDLTQSLKENGKALDFDSEKGRNNQKAIIATVTAARDAAQAKYDSVVATKGEQQALADANTEYNKYIDRIRTALLKQGISKDKVEELISAYARMPAIVATSVTTPGLDEAIARAQRLLELTNQLGSKHAAIQFSSGEYVSGRRWGGIVEHAQWGTLREAGIYSPQVPGRYMMAEQATGGELFVPKFGDSRRSLAMLNRGAGWYGHTLVPTSQAAVMHRTITTAMSAQKAGGGETVVAVVYAKDGATQALAQLVDVRVERAMDREAALAAGGPR